MATGRPGSALLAITTKPRRAILRLALLVLAGLLGALAVGALRRAPPARHRPAKWERPWARVRNPARDRLEATREVLALLDARPGASVADVGAGAGYFTFKLAAVVGPAGRVTAVDIDPEMVAFVARFARSHGLNNVEARVVPEGSPGLDAGRYDAVLLSEVYNFWQGEEPAARRTLRALAASLKPGGRLVLFQTDVATCAWHERWREHNCEGMEPSQLVGLAREVGLGPLAVRRYDLNDPHHQDRTRPGFLLAFTTADRAPTTPETRPLRETYAPW
ncbi:MAG: methyltransferase domain-containing protein [Deltaproteobacteria bacterium]|nr:methyltransferase domain-containing protein [Deltaproteobacteria bacterium]